MKWGEMSDLGDKFKARAKEEFGERGYGCPCDKHALAFAAEVLRTLPELMHVTLNDGSRAIPFEYARLINKIGELADELEGE